MKYSDLSFIKIGLKDFDLLPSKWNNLQNLKIFSAKYTLRNIPETFHSLAYNNFGIIIYSNTKFGYYNISDQSFEVNQTIQS